MLSLSEKTFHGLKRFPFQDTRRFMSPETRPKRSGTFEKRAPGARFSNVPKLYGSFSGVTVPFVSQERRGFKSSNFTVIFSFCYLKNMLKNQLSKTSGWQFHTWLFGPEKLSGRSRNGPLARVARSMVSANQR